MMARIRYLFAFTVGISVLAGNGSLWATEWLPMDGRSPEAVHIAVVGADYAFTQLPSELAAGPTLIAFENRGTKRHEMSISLLKQGVTIEQIIRSEKGSVGSRAVTDSIVGLLIARPGEQSGGQLYVNLVSGRTYLVICTLKDTPNARRHSEMGMIGGFKVR